MSTFGQNQPNSSYLNQQPDPRTPQLNKLRYYWRSGAPMVTYTIMGLCFAIWLVEVLLQKLAPAAFQMMIFYGSDEPYFVFAHPWQWFTSMFLHAPEIWHVACNMLTLLTVGPFLERLMGHWSFTALYCIVGLGGSAGLNVYCTVTGNWMMSAYGASGALFGLFGAVLVVFRRTGQDIRSMLVWMAINFAMPLVTPNVAWQAHVGGFVTGLVLAWLLVDGVPALRRRTLGVRMAVYGVAMVLLLVVVMLFCRPAGTSVPVL